MKEHATLIGSVVALTLILATALLLACRGMKDSTLLVVLTTGAVGIGQAIAGIKTTPPPPPPGTTFISTPDPNAQAKP